MDNKFNNKNTVKLKKNYDSAYEKFNKIKNGYKTDNTIIDIEYLCKNKTNFYEEQEWGFPKDDYLMKLILQCENLGKRHKLIMIISSIIKYKNI